MPATRKEAGTSPASEVLLAGTPSPEALAAFNGHSDGSAPRWEFLQKGDWVVAEIMRVEKVHGRFNRGDGDFLAYDVTVREGTERGGFSIAPGSHRRLICGPVELRRMVSLLNPQVGDVLAVAHLGRDDVSRPSRHLFRYSIVTRAQKALSDDRF